MIRAHKCAGVHVGNAYLGSIMSRWSNVTHLWDTAVLLQLVQQKNRKQGQLALPSL